MITSRPTVLISLLPVLFILSGCDGREIGRSNSSLTKAGCQKLVDKVVAESMTRLHPKKMVVIMADPRNGEILAVSSQRYGSSKQTDDSVSWEFEPGSTIKPFIVSAALNEGVVNKNTEIFCENGAYSYEGKVFRDHLHYGNLTPPEILQKSSNIGSAKIGLKLTDSTFLNYIHAFGFGELTKINLPGEKYGLLIPSEHWDKFTKPRMSFGQSFAVTPIQLTMAYCSLANTGTLFQPALESPAKSRPVRKVITRKTAECICGALQKSVSDEGTAPLARVTGLQVAGQSGTSQEIENGYYVDGEYVTEFAGFFPVEHPRAVCVVVVDQADLKPGQNFGGLVAAPIFANIAEKTSPLLGISTGSSLIH